MTRPQTIADAWLAGILDVAGCWSTSLAGQDGRLCSSLRLQIAGPPALIAAVAKVADCGTLRAKGRRQHQWSVGRAAELRALILRIQRHARTRAELYRRLLDWPVLSPGQRGDPDVQRLRFAIANDLGRLDPLAPRARPTKRHRRLMEIRTAKEAR